MLLKLLKGLLVGLLAATVCSAVSIVPRYENDSDGDDKAGKAIAAAVCVQGQNDATLCWNSDIRNHIFTGNPATCEGMHVTSAAEQAHNAGTIVNLRVVSSNTITRLMQMRWNYGGGLQCDKTVWNNIQNYRLAPTLAHYVNETIHDMYIDMMDRRQCVSTPNGQGITLDNRYGRKLCASVTIGTLPYPGRTFFPRGIAEPAGAVGTACN